MAGISGVGNSKVDLQELLALIARRRQQQQQQPVDTQDGNAVAKPAAGGQTNAADSNSDADAIAAAQTAAADKAARQAFFLFLRQNGIDPEEFRQALLAGIKAPHDAQANPSTAFRRSSPGFSVDTTA